MMPATPWPTASCMTLWPSGTSSAVLAGGVDKDAVGCQFSSWFSAASDAASFLLRRRTGAPATRSGACAVEAGENQLAFQPRNRLAHAAVDARAEGHVADRFATDVEAVRLRPLPRVTVRRREESDDLAVGGNCGTAERDIARAGAEEGLHRGFVTQRLLESLACERRIGMQLHDSPMPRQH